MGKGGVRWPGPGSPEWSCAGRKHDTRLGFLSKTWPLHPGAQTNSDALVCFEVVLEGTGCFRVRAAATTGARGTSQNRGGSALSLGGLHFDLVTSRGLRNQHLLLNNRPSVFAVSSWLSWVSPLARFSLSQSYTSFQPLPLWLSLRF